MSKKINFDSHGFHIEKSLYTKNDMDEMFGLFYDVFLSLQRKFSVPTSLKYKDTELVDRENCIADLDSLMLDCFHYDKGLIGEGYDIISYSSVFLRFLSNPKVESITRELLDLNPATALYGWTNRVRIDPPADERRTYGWHQEVFYTIPESRYLQTWAPVIRSTTASNGTIWIAPGSHKEGIAKQSWNEYPGRATQVIVDDLVINKYNQIQLEMEVGDVLFFDGKLAHKSGSNSTKNQIRFSLVGMWHDIWTENFRGPKPAFEHRTKFDQKQHWVECNKKYNWGY
jgi:hypothetical protein